MAFDLTEYIWKDGVKHWLLVFGSFAGVLLLAALVLTYITMGAKGVGGIFRVLFDGVSDVLTISIKRLLAIATLTVKEVVRKEP